MKVGEPMKQTIQFNFLVIQGHIHRNDCLTKGPTYDR